MIAKNKDINYIGNLMPILGLSVLAFGTTIFGLFESLKSTIFLYYAFISTYIVILGFTILIIKIIKNNFFVFIVALPLFIILIYVSFQPPYLWDEIAYQLALPNKYIEYGNIHYLKQYGFYSLFPFYGDAIYINILLVFGVVGAHLLGVVSYFLCGMYSYLISKELGIRKSLGIIVAFFVLCAPNIYLYAAMGKTDNLVASYSLAAIYCFVVAIRNDNLKLLILGLFLSVFSVGIKYSGLYLFPFLVIFLIYSEIIKHKGIKYILLILIGWFCMGLIVNLPWLLRNYLETSNPIFPILNSYIGDNLEFHFNNEYTVMLHQLMYGAKGLSWEQTKNLNILIAEISIQSFLIPFILFPLVGLYVCIKRSFSRESKAFVYGTGVCLLIFIFVLTWILRHFAALNAIVFICFAVLLENILVKKIKFEKFLLLIIISYMSYKASVGVYSYNNDFRGIPIKCVSLDELARESCGNQYAPYVPLALYVNSELGPNIRIATNVQPFLYLKKEFILLSPFNEYGGFKYSDNSSEFYDKLKKIGVTHLGWRPQLGFVDQYDSSAIEIRSYFKNLDANIMDLARSGRLIEIKKFDDLFLYQLN